MSRIYRYSETKIIWEGYKQEKTEGTSREEKGKGN